VTQGKIIFDMDASLSKHISRGKMLQRTWRSFQSYK